MRKFLCLLALLVLPSVSLAQVVDALDEVNQVRAERGLPPFQRDDGLTIAAKGAAEYRATNLVEGHVSFSDFTFVPEGTSATAAGCAAWPQGMGWGSCCTYEAHSHAGAAKCIGRDGRVYMHLFVRGGGSCQNGNCGSATTRTRIVVRIRARR